MKIIKEKKEIQPIIKSSVDKLVNFVKPTYGPNNSNIILKLNGGVFAFDDGVSIAREFELEDPSENAVLDLLKETAIKTSKRVKDGTTTSLIVLQGLMSEDSDSIEIIKEGAKEVKEQLKKNSKEINTIEDLKKVANIAYNHPVSEQVAEIVHKVGKDGIVTVEESDGLIVETEVSDGMKIDGGYVSSHMVTDVEREEAVHEDVPVVVVDGDIKGHEELNSVLTRLLTANQKKAIIFANDFDGDAISFLSLNQLRGNFQAVAIASPLNGERRTEVWKNICALTGAKLISDEITANLRNIKLAQDVGGAKKIIVNQNETIIIEGDKDEEQMESRKKHYTIKMKEAENDIEKNRLEKNLANLNGGIGIIKVGADTIKEAIAMIPKIENVVNSVMTAYKSGVSKGAGLALSEFVTCSPALNQALEYPRETIESNVGDRKNAYVDDEEINTAVNFVTGEIGHYIDVGVIDATDVLIAAVESAVSVACLLKKSKGLIVEVSKELK